VRFTTPIKARGSPAKRIHQSHDYETPDEIYYITDAGDLPAIAP
jgi:hypothetical protein